MTINQINQTLGHTSLQEEAMAASSTMIVTGLEKEIKLKATKISLEDPEISAQELKEAVNNIKEAWAVTPAKKHEQKKENQQEEKKENLPIKNKSQKKHKTTKKQELPFPWKSPESNTEPFHPPILTAGESDHYQNKDDTELPSFKKYYLFYVKSILKLPSLTENQVMLEKIEKGLGLPSTTLIKLQEKIQAFLVKEWAYLFKSHLLELLEKTGHSETLLEFILKLQNGHKILNLLFFNRRLIYPDKTKHTSFSHKIISGILKKQTNIEISGIEEMVEISHAAGLDLHKLLTPDKLAGIEIMHNKGLHIDNHLLEEERIKSLFLDELRLLEVSRLMEANYINCSFLNLRKRKVVATLLQLGASKEEIKKTEKQARIIAWAKCIAMLKDLHFKRIFTASIREFDQFSCAIKKLTLKSRRLGYDLDKKGLQWIETRIETLARETAEYKLKLLNSLQALERDAQREQDIKQLTTTLKHYHVKIAHQHKN